MTHRVLNGTLSFLVKDVVNILAKMYFTTKTSRPLVDRSTYHPHYRILAYNDFLYQQKKIPPRLDRPIAPPQLSRPTFKSTKDNLIDWSLSSKWFNFNGRNDSTSISHTKDLKWKIRCSTLILPTLDILNRRYPLIMKDNINCLFCLNTPESNHHLWICPETRSLIRNCFITLGNTLIDLLTKNADKLSLVVPDSVKISPTFRWAYRNEEIHPVALLFLKSYITNDLKERNSKWKNLRSELGLSKKSFKNYYKDFNQSRTPGDIRPDNQFMRRGRDSIYINPFNDYPVLSSNIWNVMNM
uniref:Uncharacterized protein n=1 Tax=Rhizophagus irregularis (strain DAOM 181602 / DAOM 197198 / MUCL 43194) TaxID=747089 RepID=U9TVR6_RHIID